MAAARLFINEKTVKKDGTTAVYALVHIGNKSLKINTRVSVDPNKFDKRKDRIKGNDKETADNNLIIDKCLSAINEIFVRYRLQHKKLTPDLLLREYHNPTNYIDFYAWMDQKLKDRLKAKEITASSERHQRVLLNKLKGFKSELSFAEIDLKFISLFRASLRADGNGINTVQKMFGYFRAYLNMAVREEIISVNPLDFIELRRVPTQIIYLTELEFKKLWGFYERNEYQENYHRVLRHFLFMCLTGVRISDLKRLMPSSVQDGNLVFIPYKTRTKKEKELTIPLVSAAQRLIEDENSLSGYLFEVYSEQKMNEYLKNIASLGGIPKKIRNHAGRHTFATLFLEKTSDVATLQRLLGHSNVSETMKYVHLSSKKITDQMANFDRLLEL